MVERLVCLRVAGSSLLLVVIILRLGIRAIRLSVSGVMLAVAFPLLLFVLFASLRFALDSARVAYSTLDAFPSLVCFTASLCPLIGHHVF